MKEYRSVTGDYVIIVESKEEEELAEKRASEIIGKLPLDKDVFIIRKYLAKDC
ncbi:MAG: hypothetical protein QXU64_04420 [Thermofilaceae archaeon]